MRLLFVLAALLCGPAWGQVAVFGQQSINGSPLRVAAARNVLPVAKTATSGQNIYVFCRSPYIIGSGDVSGIVVSHANFYFQWTSNPASAEGGEKLTGNSVTIIAEALEVGSVTTPVWYAGARQKTLTNGAIDQQSTLILPQNVGLTVFPQGTTVWIKSIVSAPTGQFIPVSRASTDGTGAACGTFDSSATTVSSVDTAGAFTTSGTAPGAFTLMFNPVLLGYYTNNPKVYVGIADSNGDGVISGLSLAPGNGLSGFVNNAMCSSGSTSPATTGAGSCSSYLQIGAAGVPYQGFTAGCTGSGVSSPCTRHQVYFAYGNVCISENGGNYSATSNYTTVWTAMKAQTNGCSKIVGLNIEPQTTTTDAWRTEANQTACGIVPLVCTLANADITGGNTFVASAYSGGTLDYLYTYGEMRGVNTDKFVVDSSANYATYDGVHLSNPAFNGPNGLVTNAFRTLLGTTTP